jgi:hypothetical protein
MINFIVNIFYKLVSRHGQKGLLISIWISTVTICLNFFSVFHIVLGVTNLSSYYDVIATGFLFIIFFYVFANYLEKRFVVMKEFRFLRLPWIFYLVGPAYFMISLIILPLTFRFIGV